MSDELTVTVTEYADFYSEWYGLSDGTLLDVEDIRGCMWRKFGDKPAKPIPDLG